MTTAIYYIGDALAVLKTLPERSVDLILTSPPFLALRSYLPADHPDKHLEGGSQPTPGAYIDWLIDVVEACDRVLAPHGSLCFELGDTYAGSGGAGGDYAENGLREGQPTFRQRSGWHRSGNEETERYRALGAIDSGSPKGGTGWPLAKSLSLIPELFRLTLVYGFNPLTERTTERWRLRNVVRWVRPNPPVGALGDKFRPATSELMVFCKSARRFFDLDAVRTPSDYDRPNLRGLGARNGDAPPGQRPNTSDHTTNPAGAPPLDWSTGLGARIDSAVRDAWESAKYDQPDLFDSNHGKDQVETVGQKIVREFVATALLDGGDAVIQPPGGYPGAHYAVWGPILLPPFIKAMCPEKVCRTCGEPSRRIVEPPPEYAATFGQWKWGGDTIGKSKTAESKAVPRMSSEYVTTGWSDCGHNDWRPGLILDPFVGSGTTLAVATGHGRDAIGIDLDERNYELALGRVGPLILQRGEVAA